ncbi:MAG: TetR/AcrR family transcriptional regulator [Frankiaceae bacterium]|nr:TetR/AcrR family transcriptional regulator [Frankiaceae bacterium]
MAVARGRGRPRAGEELDVSRLLQGALDAFAERGYDGTSVRELSRQLQVSHALLTGRFGSKEGLWFAAMEHALADSERSWLRLADAPDLDDLDALRRAIVRQVEFSAEHPQVLRIMSHEGAIDSPRIRFVVDRFVNLLRPFVEDRLDRLVAAGRIRPVPYATLHYLVVQGGGAMFASPIESALLGAAQPPRPGDIRRHAEAVADVIVAGLSLGPAEREPAR